MASTQQHEQPGLTSFDLPTSPCRSPTGLDNVSIWVEDTGNEQRVHLKLLEAPALEPTAAAATPPPPPPVPTAASADPGMDFPLVLYQGRQSWQNVTSSALVPFQKLQMDTNLNRTTLPYKSSPTGSSPGARGSPASAAARATARQAYADSNVVSSEFMHALRLGEFTQQQQRGAHYESPQLSVRVRGGRVELASPSESESVDFMGPADNIKKLFKLPYSQARVSLAVHRVGSTLVVDGELDDTDIPAGFEDFPQETMQIQQQNEEQLQQMLYEKFIYESTMHGQLTTDEEQQQPVKQDQQQSSSRGKKQSKKKKKASAQKANAIATNALGYEAPASSTQASVPHSWMAAFDDDIASESIGAAHSFTSAKNKHVLPGTTSPAKKGPADSKTEAHPPPSSSERRPSPANSFDVPTFERILNWNFHNFKMVLGSQVLLFSNKEHPAVSLKLHDMDKELSVCTVLDYYLDNVIANIPELAICMHSKGLVRGYKLVETQQIPHMSGTGRPLFDVQDVSMNASMLLKFLMENCSRPNGTYWLYRKEGENSLRLYDVNVLSQGKQLKWKYMMAMLCYRFASRASRLIYSLAHDTPRLQDQLKARQRDLLSTCMKLLEEITQAGGTAHDSICSSVSEQLADTYLREVQASTSSEDGSSELDESQTKVIVESLCKAKEHLQESIRSFEACISRDTGARLQHEDGEDNDHYVPADDIETLSQEDDDNEAEGVDSFMDEEMIRLKLKYSSACIQLGQIHCRNESWDEAAAAILESCQYLSPDAIPSDINPLEDEYLSMKQIEIDDLLDKIDFDGVANRSTDTKGIICTTGTELRCCILGLIGDIASQSAASIASQLVALYQVISGEKSDNLALLKTADQRSEWNLHVRETTDGLEDPEKMNHLLLVLAFKSYLRSLSPAVDSELYFVLMKKLGNASNELGKYFLSAKQQYEKAFVWFQRGCKIFNEIEDGINVALLCANLAHLHKILAQGKLLPAREIHYQNAVRLCTEALHQLKQNKAEMELHRKVKGELALTYLVWAVGMANNASSLDAQSASGHRELTKKKDENDVHKIFGKALALYSELGDPKQVASTHYQMASYQSRLLTRELQDQGKDDPSNSGKITGLKNRMEIARRHYEKALQYFGKQEVGTTFVLIHQELADLYAVGGRVEDVEHALLIMLNTYDAFNSSNNAQTTREVMQAMARDVVAKLKLILHQLIRLHANAPTSSRSNSSSKAYHKLERYKKMYKEVIYCDGSTDSSIVEVLATLRGIYSNP